MKRPRAAIVTSPPGSKSRLRASLNVHGAGMDGFGYISGDEPVKSVPLARYLPPIPTGIATAFLAGHMDPDQPKGGAWVLDPFGASPQLAVEMAAAGYWVLAAVNNPITHFLLETVSNPPSRAELRAALADLAASRKGEERLETHLQSLYMTECIRCQQQVPAEAFVWERASGELLGRIYHCACGDGGEYPPTEADKKLAARQAATDSLHRSRALERVVNPDDPDRRNAEEALECYLPRAVYALITIINKLDSLTLPPERRRALLALLLTTFDEASTLWPHPAERPRPRQLTVPPRFLEKNVWLALERSVEIWSAAEKLPRVTHWPELPGGEGGLCLFEGPIRNLAPYLKDVPLTAVVTAIPRPNQAYWTLSALWAGWLWGRPAAAPFKAVLRRRRYDWSWHAGALNSALKNLSEHLPLNTPVFAIIPEAEPAFLSAALIAAADAGFDLNGLALRTRFDPVEVLWHRQAFSHERREIPPIDPQSVQEAMLAHLRERGEPVAYLNLHAAGLTCMASEQALQWHEEALNQALAPILAALESPEFIHHSESSNPETGLWGLARWDSASESLPDRVEVFTVRLLQEKSAWTPRDLEIEVDRAFPGLLSPSLWLLQAVLESYAVESDGLWRLRQEDAPNARRADLEAVSQSLAALGTRLGYTLQRQETPHRLILWQEKGETKAAFYLLGSAVISKLLRQVETPPTPNSYIVLPGGRAGLLAYKLARDPSLAALSHPWKIVKFRHLRRLAAMAGLTRDGFEKNITSDPIEPPEQMKLF